MVVGSHVRDRPSHRLAAKPAVSGTPPSPLRMRREYRCGHDHSEKHVAAEQEPVRFGIETDMPRIVTRQMHHDEFVRAQRDSVTLVQPAIREHSRNLHG